jgi:predicted patatin/cPLA2 family phospholipase
MPKRALIVEGGGMRGAHTAGALAQLSRSHPAHFEVVCACSSGACTVAFWVAGQHHLYERIWRNYVHDDRLIRYRYMIQPGPVMDLRYLLYEVFVEHEPLDTVKILNSPIDFFIAATHCGTGQAHYFHNKQDIDVLRALHASSAMPIAHPLPVWYDGEPFADGGIADSIPLQKAISEGCDEFVILLTRPVGYRKEKPGRLRWPRWMFRHHPGLVKSLLNRHHLYNEQLDLVDKLERSGKALVIRPPADLKLSRLTRRRDKLLRAIEQGKRDTAEALRHWARP